jgi:hypothetical protein
LWESALKIICGDQEIELQPGQRIVFTVDQDELLGLGIRYSELMKSGETAEIHIEGVTIELSARYEHDPVET